MHIVILTANPDAAAEAQDKLGSTADRYTIAATWSEALATIDDDRPDLVVVERPVLTRIELGALLSLSEPERCPPLLLVDTLTPEAQDGAVVAQRLFQVVPDYYKVGDLRIDTRKRRATVGKRWVTLPPIQYRLLLTLAKRAGEVINCQELLRLVWEYEAEENEARELVKVHIRQIRRRLGLDPEKHHYIRSVRGFGYMLVPLEEEEETPFAENQTAPE